MESRHTLLVVGLPNDVPPIVAGLRDAAPNRLVEEADTFDEAAKAVLGWRARLEAGDTRGPDLVILDVKDPRVDAPRLIRLIRASIDHKVAIVVFSDVSDPAFLRDCFRLEANAVVHRPATPEKIREVAAAIGRYWLRINSPVPGKPALQVARET